MLNNIFNFEQKFFLTPVRTVNAQTKAATHLFSFGFREYQQKQCEATLERKSTSRFLREARLKTWTKPAPTWEHFTTSQPPNRVICMRLRILSRKPSSGQQSKHARRYNRSKSTTKQTSTTQNIFILLLFVIVLKKKNFFWYFLSFIFCNILISIFTFNFSGQDFLGQVEDALFLGRGLC